MGTLHQKPDLSRWSSREISATSNRSFVEASLAEWMSEVVQHTKNPFGSAMSRAVAFSINISNGELQEAERASLKERLLDKAEQDYAKRYHPRPYVFPAEDRVDSFADDQEGAARSSLPSSNTPTSMAGRSRNCSRIRSRHWTSRSTRRDLA